MSNTSKILWNKVTDDLVVEMLLAAIEAIEELGIEYFVVGAFARDIGMQARGYQYPPSRKTQDVDLAVLVGSFEQYEALKSRISNIPGFTPHHIEPYRFIFKEAYEIDFLPFGGITDEKGQVELVAKATVILNMPGFDEIQPWTETVMTEEGVELKISSLPGVILLKLFAWEDRPEREKDIHDIDYILKHFFDLHSEEIFGEDSDIADLYAEEMLYFDKMVSARYVGRKMRDMLQESPALNTRMLQLLKSQSEAFQMSRLMSFDNIEDNQRIIQAIYLGMLDNR